MQDEKFESARDPSLTRLDPVAHAALHRGRTLHARSGNGR